MASSEKQIVECFNFILILLYNRMLDDRLG